MDPHCGYPIVIICPSVDHSVYPTLIIQSIFSHNLAKPTLFFTVSFGQGCGMTLNQVSRPKVKLTADLWEKSMTDNIFYPGTSLAQIYPNYACRYGVCSEFVCQLPRSFIADLCVKSLFRPFIPPPVLLVLSALYYTSRMIAR